MKLVLASGSPRRRDLLAQLEVSFEVVTADIDETPRPGEAAAAYVERLAKEKASAVAARHDSNALVLAADTSVVLDEEIFGKPRDAAHAMQLLRRLVGREHRVLTGVAVEGARRESLVVTTWVRMREAREDELAWYVSTGEPLDKAGAYGMQGRGGFLVSEIRGSPTNVIGLPLTETMGLLERVGLAMPWGGTR